jgi:group I intron endonuclease
MQNNNSNGSFVPAIIYNNADTDKLMILTDNKGKAGVYQWKHIESGKIYIGSAIDLTKRLYKYYNISTIANVSSYINNALLDHGYSAFSLSILEYINVTNLSNAECRKLILEREQYYIDILKPRYNILKIAGSSLGFKHSQDTLDKISKAMKGRIVSEETINKLKELNKGEKNPMYGRIKESNPFFGKVPKNAIDVYIYSLDNELIKECSSISEAAKWLNTSHYIVSKYLSTNKVFNNKFIIRDTNIFSE